MSEHPDLAKLEAELERIRAAPTDAGEVELIVRRPAIEEREVVGEAELDRVEGMVGDCWRTRGSSSTEDGSAHPDMQITIMGARVAAAVAGEADRWLLAGDQLYADLDLSSANLPPGTRLQAGTAVLEITAEPHTGCGKFARRFGVDALKFVNTTEGRERNLRGIYAKVVEPGTVSVGDRLTKLPRD